MRASISIAWPRVFASRSASVTVRRGVSLCAVCCCVATSCVWRWALHLYPALFMMCGRRVVWIWVWGLVVVSNCRESRRRECRVVFGLVWVWCVRVWSSIVDWIDRRVE